MKIYFLGELTIGKNIIIKQLEGYVDKYRYYYEKNLETIDKYPKERNESLLLSSYTKEEYIIINDTREHFLESFWYLDLTDNGFDICGECNDINVNATN